MTIMTKHGGWPCDRCTYRWPLTSELRDAIHRATSGEAPGLERPTRATVEAVEEPLNALNVSDA